MLLLSCAIINQFTKKPHQYFLHPPMQTRTLRHPPPVSHIEINISTWAKDSHGLYDYEAAEDAYKKQIFFVKNSCKVFRDNARNQIVIGDGSSFKGNDAHISLIAELSIDRSKNTPEFKVKQATKKQNEVPNEIANIYKTSYLVVKEYNLSPGIAGYPLKPGNVIKLGRVEYMVIEAKNEEETMTLRDTNHFDQTNGIFEIKKKNVVELTQDSLEKEKEKQIVEENSEHNCKVCLCNEETEYDPLISPCNCKGSCQLIHVGCLRTWINSKVKKEIKGIASSYNFTKFECEICKFPFPQIVRFGDKDIEMMTISKPNKPYIILQSLCNKLQNKEERCLHLISTEENTPIKIGRGHECEIRITDISVSRKHAEITLKDGEFYISDTKAKFGTLIKVEEDFIITQSKTIKVQCGRTVYQFKVKGEPEEVDTDE